MRRLRFGGLLVVASGVLLLSGGGRKAAALGQQPAILQAQTSSADLPDFSVVSIKPSAGTGQTSLIYTDDGVVARKATLITVIRGAYSRIRASDEEFAGIPDWARTDAFDIDAKVDSSEVEGFQKLNYAQKGLMLQKVLAERFKLKTHEEQREQPGYDLIVAKGGTKLKSAEPGPGVTFLNSHELKAQGYTVAGLTVPLTQIVGRTVQDKTGLEGHYDIVLNWTPENANETEGPFPSIFAALDEQLGLKLIPAKHQVTVLVVDHVERPDGN